MPYPNALLIEGYSLYMYVNPSIETSPYEMLKQLEISRATRHNTRQYEGGWLSCSSYSLFPLYCPFENHLENKVRLILFLDFDDTWRGKGERRALLWVGNRDERCTVYIVYSLRMISWWIIISLLGMKLSAYHDNESQMRISEGKNNFQMEYRVYK